MNIWPDLLDCLKRFFAGFVSGGHAPAAPVGDPTADWTDPSWTMLSGPAGSVRIGAADKARARRHLRRLLAFDRTGHFKRALPQTLTPALIWAVLWERAWLQARARPVGPRLIADRLALYMPGRDEAWYRARAETIHDALWGWTLELIDQGLRDGLGRGGDARPDSLIAATQFDYGRMLKRLDRLETLYERARDCGLIYGR